jgi:hypothetical protein
MSHRCPLALLVLVLVLGCAERSDKAASGRSEAVSSASQEMSGPSLFSRERLGPALAALGARPSTQLLRLEIRARELVMQSEDPNSPGHIVERHYRDGKALDVEHATVRGKGQLGDNVFRLADVNLDAIPELTRLAVQRIDVDNGSADLVLVRRNLPETDEVRLRVYVASPRQSGILEADHAGQPLP